MAQFQLHQKVRIKADSKWAMGDVPPISAKLQADRTIGRVEHIALNSLCYVQFGVLTIPMFEDELESAEPEDAPTQQQIDSALSPDRLMLDTLREFLTDFAEEEFASKGNIHDVMKAIHDWQSRAADRADWEAVEIASTVLSAPAVEPRSAIPQHTPAPWYYEPPDSGDSSVGIFPTPGSIGAFYHEGELEADVELFELRGTALRLPREHWTADDERAEREGLGEGGGYREHGWNHANGQRVVAAINLLEGLTTDELERLQVLSNVSIPVLLRDALEGRSSSDQRAQSLQTIHNALAPFLRFNETLFNLHIDAESVRVTVMNEWNSKIIVNLHAADFKRLDDAYTALSALKE